MGLRSTGAIVGLLAAVVGACTEADRTASSRRPDLAATRCSEPQPARGGQVVSGGWRFTDVAVELGLAGQHWNRALYDGGGEAVSREEADRRRREEPAIMAGGASVTDVDGDGWEDVLLTRVGFPNQLYRNQCGKAFGDIAASVGLGKNVASAGSVWGDVDGDGDLDLFLTSILREANRLYINQGDGTFVEEGVARGAGSRRDFLPTTNFSYGAALGDIDADSDLDLVVNQWQLPSTTLRRGRSRVLMNDGSGRFTDATPELGVDLKSVAAFTTTIDDVDEDGLVDLAVAGDWRSSRLFLGTGGGRFRDATRDAGVGTDENGMGSSLEDIDGDGDLDWFVTSISGPDCSDVEFGCSGNRLYLNEGSARFRDATDEYGVRDGGWGWGSAVADFDNDGDRDVVMTNGWESQSTYSPGAQADDYEPYVADPMRFWVHEGQPPLVERAAALGIDDTGRGKALIPFDFDRDGDLDILVTRTGSTPLLYRNDGGNQKAWLRVLAVDAAGVPSIGARVTVQPVPGGPLSRGQVRAGDTYQGSGSPWVHIGLGGHERVHEVRVRWPGSGQETVLRDVEARREVVVRAPAPGGRAGTS